MANGKMTLTRLGDKLDTILNMLTVHVADDKAQFTEFRTLLLGLEDKPGLKGRLDRLEQTEASRRWHIRLLWSTIVGGVVTLLFKWIG